MDGRDNLIRPNALNHNDLLEQIQLVVVRRWQLLFLGIGTIEYLPPLIRVLHEMVVNILEVAELSCSVELPVEIRPLVIRDPIGRIGRNGDFSCWPGEEVPPLSIVDLVVALPDLDGQHEGEEQFVLFEQTPADIFIEGVCEIVVHNVQSFLQLLGRRTVLHRQHEEADEPLEGVLVHGID